MCCPVESIISEVSKKVTVEAGWIAVCAGMLECIIGGPIDLVTVRTHWSPSVRLRLLATFVRPPAGRQSESHQNHVAETVEKRLSVMRLEHGREQLVRDSFFTDGTGNRFCIVRSVGQHEAGKIALPSSIAIASTVACATMRL